MNISITVVGIGSNHCELTVGVKVFLSATILVRTSKNSLGKGKITQMCIFVINSLREGQGPLSAPLQLLAKIRARRQAYSPGLEDVPRSL